MTKAELLALKKVKGVEIGKVTNIFYDKGTDVIVIIERNDYDKFGPHKFHFGANAPELKELLETLQEYYIETLNDKLAVFTQIWERVNP